MNENETTIGVGHVKNIQSGLQSFAHKPNFNWSLFLT